MPPFIVSFMVTSAMCHMFHSLILHFPAPINLLDFYLGDSQDEYLSDDIEMQSEKSKGHSFHQNKIIKVLKISCVIMSIVYLIVIVTSPNYTFNSQFTGGKWLQKELDTYSMRNPCCPFSTFYSILTIFSPNIMILKLVFIQSRWFKSILTK